MGIFNKNKESKNDRKNTANADQKSYVSIRKTMLDENGMEYEVEEKNEIFNIDEDAKRFILKQLIKENAGPDPFWEECINDFFNKINKTEDEKIDFFKKISLNQHLFNEFTKEIVKPLEVEQIFEKYNRLLNNNERVVEENSDIKLKKIVEEVIGNNDPYWNEPVYTVVKKIIELPNESKITIAKLLDYDPKEAFVEPLTQGQISNLIIEVCKKINIGLEEISDEFIGLAYNVQYKKVKLN